ncbi:E3 ubiquitin--protein ligase, partial [Verrucomicrobia bacterium]|nr:E3 ubiquitin--protein ligase [Verrucomicrobiota bacterium]
MKTITAQLLLTGGLMAASAASLKAQPAERSGRGERPDRAAQRKQILDRFDKNKDGELDEEEREAARESFLSGGG